MPDTGDRSAREIARGLSPTMRGWVMHGNIYLIPSRTWFALFRRGLVGMVGEGWTDLGRAVAAALREMET